MNWLNRIPELSEEKYRFLKAVVLFIFVAAFIVLGIRFTENGRYIQYDYQKDHVVYGNSMRNDTPAVLDSRTGKKTVVE